MGNLGVLAQLLDAFDQQLILARDSARVALEQVAYLNFAPYRRFRTQIDETVALVCVLEGQLDSLHGIDTTDLRKEFIRLHMRMLSLEAATARALFSRLQSQSALPLGARELFGPELNMLQDSEAKLAEPDYQTPEGERLVLEIRCAIGLIESVLARSSDLPVFGAPQK